MTALFYSCLVRLFVDIVGLVLGVDDLLALVETKVAGQHIAERDGEKKIRHTVISEQLKADEQRGDRTVCHAAEDRGHANRRAKCRRKSENISEQTAECRSGKERRDDLAAFVSCAECDGGKKHFQEERLRADGTVHAAGDDVDARTVVGLIPDEQCQHDDNASTGEDAQIGIFEKLLIKVF